MKAKTLSRAELYGTKEVAEILSIPEWRVKNFSEGAAYGLPPALRVGSGRGSRRLYGWADIFRIAIAHHLVACGFTAEAVGGAIQEIPKSVLTPYEVFLHLKDLDADHLPMRETPLLVAVGGAWRVCKANNIRKEIRQTITHTGNAAGLFVLNLATFCDRVYRHLYDYWSK